jgi:hypothetical protein
MSTSNVHNTERQPVVKIMIAQDVVLLRGWSDSDRLKYYELVTTNICQQTIDFRPASFIETTFRIGTL